MFFFFIVQDLEIPLEGLITFLSEYQGEEVDHSRAVQLILRSIQYSTKKKRWPIAGLYSLYSGQYIKVPGSP